MLKDCDANYREPTIITDYEGDPEFYENWVLTPDDDEDVGNVSSDNVKLGSQEFSAQSYKSGEESGYSERGFFLIFNQETFIDGRGEKSLRRGTEHDTNKLKKVMTELGFEVRVYHDKTAKQIRETLQTYSEADMSNCEMFGCAMLSHGLADGVILTIKGDIVVNDLVDPIKANRTLVGKPKLFFLQACRGHRMHDGFKITDVRDEDDTNRIRSNQFAPNSDENDQEASSKWYKWPCDADILVHFAQSEGYTSNRNPYWGSVFVLALCHFMRFAYKFELHDLLIRVNALVALRETNCPDPRSDKKKQMPQIQSQLTKLMYFKYRPITNKKTGKTERAAAPEKLKFDHFNIKKERGIDIWHNEIPQSAYEEMARRAQAAQQARGGGRHRDGGRQGRGSPGRHGGHPMDRRSSPGRRGDRSRERMFPGQRFGPRGGGGGGYGRYPF